MRPALARTGRVIAASLAVVLLLPAVAAAQARTVDEACSFADPAPFTDKPVDEFGVAIDCVFHYGVTTGATATTYAPNRAVQRDQMASFLIRLVQVANGAVAANPSDHFDDDNGNFHEANINRLFETGITTGVRAGVYQPQGIVTRDQMATFIARAIEYASGSPLADPAKDHFTDDNGNFHERRINQLADIGVVQGTAATTYAPRRFVTRGQMALFLARGLDFLTETRSVPIRRIGVTSATASPELLSAARVSGSQVVRFTFDEDVNANAIQAASLHVYSFTAAMTAAQSAQRDSADPKSVLATFADDVRLDLMTTAGAARSAVQDSAGNLSPEGSAPLAAVSQAGTDAPDLVSAAPIQSSGTTFSFQFDEVAHVVDTGGYHLILSDGSVVNSTGAQGGSQTHVVTFPTFAPSQVVRAYVEAGTVSDAAQPAQAVPGSPPPGELNPQQAADVAAGGQVPNRPDLVSFELDVATGTAKYTFDEAVSRSAVVPGAPLPTQQSGSFRLYYLDGSSVASTNATADSSDTRSMIVTFSAGQVNDLVVGASVDENTVTSAAQSSNVNRVDEVRQPISFPAGSTAGPDLVAVGHTQAPSNTPPNSASRTVVFIFDQPVDDVSPGSLSGTFAVYSADGVRTPFTTNGPQPACAISGARVTCTANSAASAAAYAAIGDAARAGVAQGAVQSLTGGHQNPASSRVI